GAGPVGGLGREAGARPGGGGPRAAPGPRGAPAAAGGGRGVKGYAPRVGTAVSLNSSWWSGALWSAASIAAFAFLFFFFHPARRGGPRGFGAGGTEKNKTAMLAPLPSAPVRGLPGLG